MFLVMNQANLQGTCKRLKSEVSRDETLSGVSIFIQPEQLRLTNKKLLHYNLTN